MRELGRRFFVEIVFLPLKASASFYAGLDRCANAVRMLIQIRWGSGIQRYV